jgi:hypothetical protein
MRNASQMRTKWQANKISLFPSKPLYNLPDNRMLMKTHLSLLLIAILLLLAGHANASLWFKVIDVTPIEVAPNSEANFTAYVQGLGSERAYVELVFRNMTEGLTISCPKKIRNVFPKGVTEYNCTVMAGDVAPGNYSFVVDAIAASARPGKMTAFINVVEAKSDLEEMEIVNQTAAEAPAEPKSEESPAPDSRPARKIGERRPAEPEAKEAPAPGAMVAVIALLLVLRRMKS